MGLRSMKTSSDEAHAASGVLGEDSPLYPVRLLVVGLLMAGVNVGKFWIASDAYFFVSVIGLLAYVVWMSWVLESFRSRWQRPLPKAAFVTASVVIHVVVATFLGFERSSVEFVSENYFRAVTRRTFERTAGTQQQQTISDVHSALSGKHTPEGSDRSPQSAGTQVDASVR